MKVFLAPRSNETSYDNFLSTIEHGVDFSTVAPHLDKDGTMLLRHQSKLFAWGNKETKKASWDKMEPGDLVLFYRRGTFVCAGRLFYKQHSKALGLSLWPPKPGDKPWSCVFFLKDITPINLPLSEIISLGEYQGHFIVQGFMPLRQQAVKNILKKYGSVNAFLNAFKTSSTEEVVRRAEEASAGNKKSAIQFESEITQFLKEMEFSDVDGARDTFRINGIQVDACGGWEDTLLVVECKCRKDLGRKDLRESISAFRGKIPILEKGFAKDPVYGKYKFFVIFWQRRTLRYRM